MMMTFLSFLCLVFVVLLAHAQLDVLSNTSLVELSAALSDLGYPSLVDLHVRDVHRARSTKSCTVACQWLQHMLPTEISQPGTAGYVSQQQGYWSAIQAEVEPRCRVQPTKAADVAATVLIAQFYNCSFAVKGGGHAAFAGASNIQDGITIDLSRLKTVKVSSDKTIVQSGGGNTWYDIYTAIEPYGIQVVGGRVADIGMGLVLGGGISFFSGFRGWACDNVKNFELVTASGAILQVNPQTYPDLYWALRGGGNNFGVVTRFDLDSFPQGVMWGGSTVYVANSSTTPAILEALTNFAVAAPGYPKAGVWVAFVYYQGQFLTSNEYTYADPMPNPPAFSEFLSIPGVIASTERIANLSTLTLEGKASNPSGLREHYTTATYGVSLPLVTELYEIWQEETLKIADIPGLIPALVLQPIGLNVLQQMKKNGGNALGLADRATGDEGPFILLNISIMWQDPDDDVRVYASTAAILERTQKVAESLGVADRYIYQNYAQYGQKVFAGYGIDNNQRLMAISRKYDPRGVFQELQPGYFKLSG